jgi:glucose-1-phosphate cytidylyltransferase
VSVSTHAPLESSAILSVVKAVILAGGLGTRLAEETSVRPKPMVEIGGRPILWHIMNTYAYHGVEEFVLALGYMGEFVKEYFLNFYAKNNDITVELSSGRTTVHEGSLPNWVIHLADTGAQTQTGGRVKRLERWLKHDQTFMLTYGDGVADVDIAALLAFHRSHGKLATMTAVRPPSRFGEVDLSGDAIRHFNEKPQTGEGWINGGFFVLEREVLNYIDGDDTYWERDPLERLAREGQLMAYRHPGFWQPMDTLREKRLLEELWQSGQAPWKVWQ